MIMAKFPDSEGDSIDRLVSKGNYKKALEEMLKVEDDDDRESLFDRMQMCCERIDKEDIISISTNHLKSNLITGLHIISEAKLSEALMI